MAIIVTFPKIISLKCSCVRGRTEAELGLVFSPLHKGSLIMVGFFFSHLEGGWSTKLMNFFQVFGMRKKVRYPVMLELMPSQAVNLS